MTATPPESAATPVYRPDQLLGARHDTPDMTGPLVGFEPFGESAQESAAVTPGQAAYEARQAAKARRMGAPDSEPDSTLVAIIGLRWEELPAGMRADEEAGAQAAIAAWQRRNAEVILALPDALDDLAATEPQPAPGRQHDFSCHADDRIHAEDCECRCHDGQPAPELAGDTEPVMAPAVARPLFGSTLMLAIHPDQDDEDARKGEEAIRAATAGDGVTVVAVRGVEALRTWEPQPAPGGSHIGRSWQGHATEDECPCPKAPCGLVVQETVSEACDQHPLSAGRTIRQGHRADQCPAAPADNGQPAPELAAARPDLGTAWRLLNETRERLNQLAAEFSAATENDSIDGYTRGSLYMAIRAEMLHQAAGRIREALEGK